MTTPDPSSGGEQPRQKNKSKKGRGVVGDAARETVTPASEHERKRREKIEEPYRKAPAASSSTEEGQKAEERRAAAAARLNASIAETMVVAREVIDKNTREVRAAADRFRNGRYHASEIPNDAREVATELIKLARSVSRLTLDLCEELVAQSAFKATPGDGPPIPAFRSAAANPIRVTLRFANGEAKAHTTTLTRPRAPTPPTSIQIRPFEPLAGHGQAISGVKVDPDISADDGSLVVTVTLPPKPTPGLYSAMVFAEGEGAPLGLLTIEVTK